ncbi:MAG: hypothetical protein H5T66_01235 [Chloroflexi bacterium]|nr:hypothetical protein [Chloroflexota bacterium]
MSTSRMDDLQKRARRAILSHAIFRLESGLTIAMTLLLAWFLPRPFAWWRGWYWLALGGIAWVLIVITSITDEASAQAALMQMLSEAPRPPRLRSPHYREKVEQALEYRQKIEQALFGMRAGILRDYLLQTMVDLSEWLRMIYTLAERLDVYEHDEILQRDRAAVEEAISALQRQLRAAPDAATRARIESLLAARREQQESLNKLQGLMAQAQFRLEETLSALGTAYSQFLMIGAQKAESTAHQELAQRMQAQVQELEDILTSMQQVYDASHSPRSAEKREEE